MGDGQTSGDGETDTSARCVTRSGKVRSVEAFDNVVKLVRGESVAGVRNGDDGDATMLPPFDVHVSTWRGVTQ